MASGVAVNDEVVETYQSIKMGHSYKFVIYKLNDDLTEIVVQEKAEKAEYSDFIGKLPEKECRYAVFDFDYKLADGSQRDKILFIVWCPDSAKIKDKMLYASSKDALRKKLVGVHLEVQATDMDEVEYDEIYQKVSAGGTK